jgi:hypothetical protein
MAQTKVAPKTKLSVNLTDEAAEVVRELANRRGVSVSDVIRESIALYRFAADELAKGAQFELTRDDGKTRERVHFVFSP